MRAGNDSEAFLKLVLKSYFRIMNQSQRLSATQLPFVLFQIQGGLYAVSAENVREIVQLPPVSIVPDLPPEIRGVIN